MEESLGDEEDDEDQSLMAMEDSDSGENLTLMGPDIYGHSPDSAT